MLTHMQCPSQTQKIYYTSSYFLLLLLFHKSGGALILLLLLELIKGGGGRGIVLNPCQLYIRVVTLGVERSCRKLELNTAIMNTAGCDMMYRET